MNSRERWVFWGILVLALGLRLVTIGDRSFDGDEGVIGLITDGSFRDLLNRAATDVHPPLYHSLVWGTRQFFGTSEWSLRLVGVLAGVGLVALAPALGRSLKLDWRLLALLLATSPFLVYTSQDARMYSLLVLLALSAWLLTIRLSSASRWPVWLGWGAVNLALVYTHHLGWFILGLELLTLLIWQRSVIVGAWQRVVVTLGLIGVAYLPQLGTTVTQFQGRLAEQSIGASIIERISGLIGALYRMLAGRTFLDLNPRSVLDLAGDQPLMFMAFLLTLIVPFAVVGLGKLQDWDVPARRQAVVLIELSLLLGLVVGTVAIQASRYLAYLAPFLLAFLALGLITLWPRSWGKALAVIVGLTVVAGLWTQYTRHNQAAGMATLAQAVETSAGADDAVYLHGAFAGGERWAYQHYAISARPVIDHYSAYVPGTLDELRATRPATRIAELLEIHPQVWFADQTYTADILSDLSDRYQTTQMTLGVDKEGQPLTMWQVSKR